MPETPCFSLSENDTPVEIEMNCDEMQIPDHAILRFAKFLLPKIQADLGDPKAR